MLIRFFLRNCESFFPLKLRALADHHDVFWVAEYVEHLKRLFLTTWFTSHSKALDFPNL